MLNSDAEKVAFKDSLTLTKLIEKGNTKVSKKTE